MNSCGFFCLVGNWRMQMAMVGERRIWVRREEVEMLDWNSSRA